MNEETRKALEQFVIKMLSAVEQSASWTSEQAPLVVQEWLRWQAAYASIWIVLAMLVLLFVAKRWKWAWASEQNEDFPMCVIILIPATVASITLIANTIDLVKVLVAPRVIVLEKFMELVR